MNESVMTEEQYDALKEMCNVAMGKAGAALATLFDCFVKLTVPEIVVLASGQILGYLGELEEADEEVGAVRQSFYGALRGEAIALHRRAPGESLVDLLGHEGGTDAKREREVLLDVSNVLNGAVVNGITEQLGVEAGFSPPSILSERVKLRELLLTHDPAWRHVLLCAVHFRLEGRESSVRELIFLPDESFAVILAAVDRSLEALA